MRTFLKSLSVIALGFALAFVVGNVDQSAVLTGDLRESAQMRAAQRAATQQKARKTTKKKQTAKQSPPPVVRSPKSGVISGSETWQGDILLEGTVTVATGATLTINAGTTIFVVHNRDYKNPEKVSLNVFGKLLVKGKAKKPVLITSDANPPVNGDWGGIRFLGNKKSTLQFMILEFATTGIVVHSRAGLVVGNSVLRWNNQQGMEVAGATNVAVRTSRMYQNGGSALVVHDGASLLIRSSALSQSKQYGVDVSESKATIQSSVIEDNGAGGIALRMSSRLISRNTTLRENGSRQLNCVSGRNIVTSVDDQIIPSNDWTNCREVTSRDAGALAGAGTLHFALNDQTQRSLDYSPGDQDADEYTYIYEDDATRSIIGMYGEGLGQTWAVTTIGPMIFAATPEGRMFVIDGDSGKLLRSLTMTSPSPVGITYDGQSMWVVDSEQMRLYAVDPETMKEVQSHDLTDTRYKPSGITWDGEYLYVFAAEGNILYQMNRQGRIVGVLNFIGNFHGGIAAQGSDFWIPCKNGICKVSRQGKLMGKIYPAAKGSMELHWQQTDKGGFLWATYQTNPDWTDAKILKLQVKDIRKALGEE